MKVRAYVSPIGSYVRQTGVSRHVVEMLGQLGKKERGIDLSLLVNRAAYQRVETQLPKPLREVRKTAITGPEGLVRRLLIGTKILRADRGLEKSDWVYAPNAQPVYCKSARSAVTIHESVSFEKDEILGNGVSRRKRAKDALLLKRTLERADLVCVVSEYLKRRVLEIVPAFSRKTFVNVGNGAADVFYAPRSEADDEVLKSYGLDGKPFALVCGDMVYRKGADILVAVAKALKARKNDLVIAVAGRKRDEKLCTDDDLANTNLRLLGHVPAERLAALMRGAKTLLMPSRYETFGIPAVEAMAAGTPVICSSVHALPEIVGDAGVYVSLDSADDLLHHLLEMLESESLRERLIAAGKQRAKQFTWAQCASRLVEAMQAV